MASKDLSFERTLAGPSQAQVAAAPPEDVVLTRGASTSAGGIEKVISHGQLVGRYVVLSALGSGGMGVVYAAYDPQLDRKVAVKLLHAEAISASGATKSKVDGQQRLQREAQAMARLRHPNVVAVHDVGVYEDRIFIAMEFVEGGTLKQWLRARPRTRQEVLSVFVQAGRGLQAAHEAGLVHRDFKPDNVLVSLKGQAQVLDFGLAKTTEEGEPGGPSDRPSEGVSTLNTHLTQVGAILGTPAYMSPEQHLGEATDARTDQFSFCVALYEALYGTPPFHGENMATLAQAVLSGQIAEAPRESYARVPPWLRRILLRGLAVDPAQRYSTMSALLDELARDPSGKRVRWLLALGACAAVGLGALGWAKLHVDAGAACESTREQLAGVWDEARRAEVAAAFAGAGDAAFTAETFRRVEGALDAYAGAWVGAQAAACRAVHGEASRADEVAYLRSACLARRLAELRAVVDLLAGADAAVVERSVSAVAGLGAVAACSDDQVLTTSVVPPSSEEARAAVSRLRSALDAARAEAGLGRYEAGLARARAALTEARALSYPPALAEALVVLGELENMAGRPGEAEATLTQAIRAAARGRHPRAGAEAWVALVEGVGVHQVQSERASHLQLGAEAALAWDGDDDVLGGRLLVALAQIQQNRGEYAEAAKLAEAALARVGDADEVRRRLERAKVLGVLGNVAYSRGEYEPAEKHLRDALAVRREVLGPDHPEVASALNSLGNNELARGRYPEARAIFEQVLAIRTRVLGPRHVLIGDSETSLGAVMSALGDHRAAREHYARAVEIRRASYGDENQRTAAALNNLGSAELALGDQEAARQNYEAARAIQEKVLGPDHPELAYTLTNLGLVLRNQDRFAESIAYYERALRLREAALAADDPTIGHTLDLLGDALAASGDLTRALPTLERALKIRESALGPEHPDVASTLYSLGEAKARAKQPTEAIALLRRSVAVLTKVFGEMNSDVATVLVALAEVELAAEPAAAVEHAERALGIRMAGAEVPQSDRAEAQFLLARALARQGERARALPMATLARATYTLEAEKNKVAIAAIDAWFKKGGR